MTDMRISDTDWLDPDLELCPDPDEELTLDSLLHGLSPAEEAWLLRRLELVPDDPPRRGLASRARELAWLLVGWLEPQKNETPATTAAPPHRP